MRNRAKLLWAVLALWLTGCQTIDMTNPGRSYKDESIVMPNNMFLETQQSKTVTVGSAFYAQVNACQLLKRYRIRTNADFISTVNLMKNRAYHMGAKWITIVQHSEVDKFESAIFLDSQEVIVREGTDLGSSRYLTTLTADLYDCPCNTNACSGR